MDRTTRAATLNDHMTRQQRLLEEYEHLRDLADDPKAIARADHQIQLIRAALSAYQAELEQLTPGDRADTGIGARAAARDVRVLFLSALPDGEKPLRIDREMRQITEKLRLSNLRDRFTMDVRLAVRPEDLTQALFDVSPHIVHFSGHGLDTGELCLEDRNGAMNPVTPDALAALFALVADSVEGVLLNACYSEVQAEAIVRHVPFAIGMSDEIPDDAAIVFASGFYQSLAAGHGFERAFESGVVQLRLQNMPDHLTPVLLRKSQ